MITSDIIYADNCGACGEEFLSTELTPIKLGEKTLSRVRVCLACLAQSDPYIDFKEAVESISNLSDVRTPK